MITSIQSSNEDLSKSNSATLSELKNSKERANAFEKENAALLKNVDIVMKEKELLEKDLQEKVISWYN